MGQSTEVVQRDNLGSHGRPVEHKESLSRSFLKVQAQSCSLDKSSIPFLGEKQDRRQCEKWGQFKAQEHLVIAADSSLVGSKKPYKVSKQTGQD